MNNTEMALNYYRSAIEDRQPDYVPARVKLAWTVTGDGPFRSMVAYAGEYGGEDCHSNKLGAVSVRMTDGKFLGVKPNEFEVIEWRENL